MDLFMPAERVLYDRAYYLSDEAERDYAFEVAEEHGVDVGEVLYSDELMKEVRDALDRDIDLYLDDEIANFDSMLRELKRGEDPEHPAEISVVAMGSVGRWDGPSRGLVAANSLRDLFDIQIDTRRVAGRVRGPRNGDKTVTGIHNLSICNIGRQAEQVLIVDKCCACPIPAAADNHKLVYLGLRSAILNNGHKSAPSRLCFPVS